VWFNLAAASLLSRIARPAALAQDAGIPYWIIVQAAHENGFPGNDREADASRHTLVAARRVIFIAEGNRRSVERSIGTHLPNALMSANTVSENFLSSAAALQAPRQTGRATFLNLARFQPQDKGHHLLLEILSQDTWMQRDWRLLLVGGGFLSETLNRLVRYYGFEGSDRVEVVGFVEDVLPIIARADLIVMPSLVEGTPFAALEAMAAGRPVVATPIGGFPELVQHGQSGWLAEAATAQHFGEALEKAWSMRAVWATVGREAAVRVVKHYRAEPVLAELQAFMHADARERRAS
jgi:glycosyltransferase involved in cell wall biosynthesis